MICSKNSKMWSVSRCTGVYCDYSNGFRLFCVVNFSKYLYKALEHVEDLCYY